MSIFMLCVCVYIYIYYIYIYMYVCVRVSGLVHAKRLFKHHSVARTAPRTWNRSPIFVEMSCLAYHVWP